MNHVGAMRFARDPFGEHRRGRLRRRVEVLGAAVHFDSDSPQLLQLVDAAYRSLPVQQASSVNLAISLRERGTSGLTGLIEPPALSICGGAGLLCGMVDANNFVIVSPQTRSALVNVSTDMLAMPYHARYELIEFAVFALASRVQNLLPLHAGCISADGRGVLLIGESGAGKSTAAWHCLESGMELVTEDSTFVAVDGLRATGVPNFLHLRKDALRFLNPASAAAVRDFPTIRRRSGVEKYEIDVRRTAFRMPRESPALKAVLFLSGRSTSRQRCSGPDPLLTTLSGSELRQRLVATQSYAAGRPSWTEFLTGAASLPAYELSRGRHPVDAVRAVRSVLATVDSGSR